MEIGPFSLAGNEKQMWFGSWGADSCGVRGLRLHEETRDCGYKNSLKPPRLSSGVQPRPGEPSPTPTPHLLGSPCDSGRDRVSPEELGESRSLTAVPSLSHEKRVEFGFCSQLRALPLGGCPGGARDPLQHSRLPPRVGLMPLPRPANTFYSLTPHLIVITLLLQSFG